MPRKTHRTRSLFHLKGKKKWRIAPLIWGGAIFVFVGASFLVYMFLIPQNGEPPFNAPYRQADVPLEERVEDLLSRMTLEEKVGQMALVEKNSIGHSDVRSYGIGGILSGAGANPEDNSVEGWREMVVGFTEASLKSRTGIPVLYGVDAIHGHTNLPVATVFPHAIGLGSAGDPELVARIALATAEELKATGVRWNFSPTLDLPQDIRWGRVYEAYSDDPVLAGRLGASYLRGLQGEYHPARPSEGQPSVLATVKHYIGVGNMLWGTAVNETYFIDQGRTLADERMLREVYLPPFKEAVDAGAGSVMVGLNSWDDRKLSAEKYLLTDVLKGELEFSGFVVSDWYGVYEIDRDKYRASVTAINAGVDMVMLPFAYKTFIRDVTTAVERGDISEERIDDAVRRILRAKFALGLFDQPLEEYFSDEVVGSDAHRLLAREAVQKSLVLLKNEGEVLPLTEDISLVRVAGSSADNVGRQSGAWTVAWQGVDGNVLPGATSLLAGIRERAPEGVEIEYDALANFEEDGVIADVGIAIVGERPYAEGVGDTAFPVLDPEDIATIARLRAVSREVVVILVTGRPLLIRGLVPSWDALIVAWLPGSEGGGVADVLFGDVPFTGKLPLPWPGQVGQLPIDTEGNTADGTSPLFPRYFGLE